MEQKAVVSRIQCAVDRQWWKRWGERERNWWAYHLRDGCCRQYPISSDESGENGKQNAGHNIPNWKVTWWICGRSDLRPDDIIPTNIFRDYVASRPRHNAGRHNPWKIFWPYVATGSVIMPEWQKRHNARKTNFWCYVVSPILVLWRLEQRHNSRKYFPLTLDISVCLPPEA